MRLTSLSFRSREAPFRLTAGGVPTFTLARADAATNPFVETGIALAAAAPDLPSHDPPLTPRDEAIFLLHVAAEIEHALMVQYLYAAYSLDPDASGLSTSQSDQVAAWKQTILSIAKEEMAHFVSVQNILLSLGGPLNFEREDYPFRSAFYPFPFRLEPLTIVRRSEGAQKLAAATTAAQEHAHPSGSLNRYVAAEMPALDQIDDPNDRALVEELTGRLEVNRVGLLFERLVGMFGGAGGLQDSDFDPDRAKAQARPEEWGGTGGAAGSFHPLIRPVHSRAEALALLHEIGEQGEGHENGAAQSHFQRFLKIYRELEAFDPAQSYRHPVPTNPSTGEVVSGEGATPILNPHTRQWAQLLNLRYRLLLGYLWHFLHTEHELFTPAGDRTGRGWLVIWTFYEMSHVKAAGELLVRLDLDETGAGGKAGAPFELPYALVLPDPERDRWRHHLDVLTAAENLAGKIAPKGGDDEAAVLAVFRERDGAARSVLEALLAGTPAPAVRGFEKVRQILDEGLRGFPIQNAPHDAFWHKSEADFVAESPAGLPAVEPGNGRDSNLVKALRGEAPFGSDLGTSGGFIKRMPAGRAPIDPTRIAFIEKWIDGLGPGGGAGSGGGQTHGGGAMGRFQEVIDILDGAVGGSTAPIGAHGPFWRSKTKAQFIAASVFGQKLLTAGDGKNSNLVKALRGEAPFGSDIGTPGASFRRMPAGRPAVPASKIDVIEKWIDDGCPD